MRHPLFTAMEPLLHQARVYRVSDLLKIAGLVALYALITEITIRFFSVKGTVILIWPAGWLALSVVLIGGKKYWPGIFTGAFAACLIMGASISGAVPTALGSTAGALVGALILEHVRRFDLGLTSVRDYLYLGVTAVASSGVHALFLTVASLSFGAIADPAFAHLLFAMWQKDALGILLVTPIILAWQRFPWSWFDSRRLTETIACFGLSALTGHIIFLGLFDTFVGPYSKAFLMFVFIAWSAVRFGRQGVFLVIAVTGVQALMGAMHGIGFFANDLALTSLTNLWFYMIVLTNVGLALDFVLYKLRRSEQREKTRNLILEMLARHAPLLEILQVIVHNVEKENTDTQCCILLVGDEGQQIFKGMVAGHSNASYPVVRNIEIDVTPRFFSQHVLPGKHVIIGDLQDPDCFHECDSLANVASLHRCWSRPVHSHSGKLLGAIAMYRKNASVRTAEDERLIKQIANLASIAIDQSRINEELQQAMLVYQNSSDAMTVSDADGVIINVNPAFTTLTGYTPREIVGHTHKKLSSGLQDKAFYQSMWSSINTTGRWQGEIMNRRKNGEIYIEWLTINTIFHEDGSVHRRIALFSDITHKKETEALIWKQANFDALTGLPNRSMFLDRLGQEIKKAYRDDLPLALLFIDLDHFKEVNDTLGHTVGDALLKEAAKRLASCVRDTDTVTRLGGDEFTVILGELDQAGNAERVVNEILLRLAEPFRLGEEVVYVTASIGITLFPEDAGDLENLLKNADQAMYAAKRSGRNRYSYFTPSMQEAAQNRMRLGSDLRNALENRQFRLEYQPIIELATGRIKKAEALIRWDHPVRGTVSPAQFIPIAEETEIIIGIGEWVFREAAQQAMQWRKHLHPDFQISINQSPVQLRQEDEHPGQNSWTRHLAALGLSGEGIVVEITEGVLLDARSSVIQRLRKLRQAGIQISLDDFGTGYSSLSYLTKFDIDYLKIDQSFVRHLTPESDDMALCEAIIVMAHKLGMKVVAEGVETALQNTLLTSAGCDYGQGYYFSRSVSADRFEALFTAGTESTAGADVRSVP
jgi:diguanylate cyclase (GGDEF)-like protein/PAS domain S-box-containing protein